MADNAVLVPVHRSRARSGAFGSRCSAAVLGLLLLCVSARARAQQAPEEPAPTGKNCLGTPRSTLSLEHSLVGSINPLGLENRFRLSLCAPLIRRPGVLFDFSNVEAGLVNYVSPTHFHLGGFVNLSPLSVLVLRAEVTGFFIWPLSLQGAGYIPLADYRPFTRETLSPPEGQPQAGQASGVRTLLGATLQGQVPLGKRLSVAAVNYFTAEFWRAFPVGQDLPFYYLTRNDVTMKASGDWVLSNTAVLLLLIDLSPRQVLRLGVMDDLALVPANNNYLGNLVAGLIAYQIKDVAIAKNLQIFIRAGTYTHHAFRDGFVFAGGLSALYDLTPARWHRPSP